MRKLMISTSAVATIATLAVLTIPNVASASTPLEKFKEMRSALALAANRGEISVEVVARPNGEVDYSGTLNGTKLPTSFPLKVVSKEMDGIANIVITVDFDPSNFTTIKAGRTPNSIQMVYRELPDSIIVVELDPKSKLPTSWTTDERLAQASPATHFKVRNVAAPKHVADTIMRARLHLRVGQSATVTVGTTEN